MSQKKPLKQNISSLDVDLVSQPESLLRPDDAALAEKAYPAWKSLFLESFMLRSKDSYPLPWLMREIVQNFIDGNQVSPATLNGVKVQKTTTSSGSTLITVTGLWPFERYDKLVSLGSGKTDEIVSAGGNGIGFKQTILRLMRDFEVKKCQVEGESWTVEYQMATAPDINDQLEKIGDRHHVEQGSLMVKAFPSTQKGRCRYIFEVEDPRVEAAFEDFNNLGVSEQNIYLQDLDFKSEFGGLKWLPVVERPLGQKETKSTDPKAQQGRLFINGQVYRFENQNDQNFWGGPEGVTVQLNKSNFPLTLDRPPARNYEVLNHCTELINSMKREDLQVNLVASEHLWTNSRYNEINYYGRDFCLLLVERIVGRLSAADYEQLFGHKKYLCRDKELSKTKEEQLREDGYTLCPKFFEKINMPKASSKFSELEKATLEKPKDNFQIINARFKASTEHGIEVPYEKFGEQLTFKNIGKITQTRLKGLITSIELKGQDKNIIRINLSHKIKDTEELVGLSTSPTNLSGKLVLAVRGIAHAILNQRTPTGISEIYMSQGQYITTFASTNDQLLIKNVEASTDGTFIEITLAAKDAKDFYAGLTGIPFINRKSPIVKESADQNIDDSTFSGFLSSQLRFLKTPAKIMSAVSAAAGLVLGLEMGLDAFNERDRRQLDQQLSEAANLPAYDDTKINLNGRKKRTIQNILESNGSPEKTSDEDLTKRFDKAAGGSNLKKVFKGFFGLSWADKPQEEYTVENFEIVPDPSQIQLQQLRTLKEYFFLTTGFELPEKLYVFKGRGAYGLHKGGTISIHEQTLKFAGFEQAVGILAHEVAHGKIHKHDSEFSAVVSAFQSEIENTLANIARKPESARTAAEKRLLVLEGEWNDLQEKSQDK